MTKQTKLKSMKQVKGIVNKKYFSKEIYKKFVAKPKKKGFIK